MNLADLSAADVEQIDVYAECGMGLSCSVAKLSIVREHDGFRRELIAFDAQHTLIEERDDVPIEPIDSLIRALAAPPVTKPDPALFEASVEVVRGHFESVTSGIHPGHACRVRLRGGRTIDVSLGSHHAFLLPAKVRDWRNDVQFETFHPELSRALAAILPDGFLTKDILADVSGTLREEERQYQNREGVWSRMFDPESNNATEEGADEFRYTIEEVKDRINRLSAGEELPEEKEEAERTGEISRRLLKRIPPEVMRDLLARGANPNVADEWNQTALMMTVWGPFDRARFDLLVQAGADLEARRTNDGLTGLHIACFGPWVDAAEHWMRAGADIHARGAHGETPLMLATGSLQLVRMLLEAGAEINAVDNDGDGAVNYAISRQSWMRPIGCFEVIEALIAAGADLNARNRNGLLPDEYARLIERHARLVDEAIEAIRIARDGPNSESHEEKERRWQMLVELAREDGYELDAGIRNDVEMAQAVVKLIARLGRTE